MRRRGITWGIILVVIGLVILADNLGLLSPNAWQLLWPLLVIALGLRIMFLGFFRSSLAAEHLSVPLAGAPTARVLLRHGAGHLDVTDGVAPGLLLDGDFDGGVEHRETRSSDSLTAELRSGRDAWRDARWDRGRGLDWRVRLGAEAPLAIDFEGGASENRLDLTRLPVRDLRIKTGASSTWVTLPASAGETQVRVNTGAASVNLLVPDGVAARIVSSGALSSVVVNQSRFPRVGSEWRSPDYDTAVNRADISIEVGVGSVRVD